VATGRAGLAGPRRRATPRGSARLGEAVSFAPLSQS
jgi:hypothetical protein